MEFIGKIRVFLNLFMNIKRTKNDFLIIVTKKGTTYISMLLYNADIHNKKYIFFIQNQYQKMICIFEQT